MEYRGSCLKYECYVCCTKFNLLQVTIITIVMIIDYHYSSKEGGDKCFATYGESYNQVFSVFALNVVLCKVYTM